MVVVPILPRRGAYSVIPSPDGRPVSGLFADLALELETAAGGSRLEPFRIDPGAGCSGMSLARATQLGILRNDDRIVSLRTRTAGATAATSTVRIGRLIVRLPFLRADPFDWPVIFHPGWPASNPALLGLAGVIGDLTIHFDGTPNAMSAFGSVTLAIRQPPAQPLDAPPQVADGGTQPPPS